MRDAVATMVTGILTAVAWVALGVLTVAHAIEIPTAGGLDALGEALLVLMASAGWAYLTFLIGRCMRFYDASQERRRQ